jgi:hypothetical protein
LKRRTIESALKNEIACGYLAVKEQRTQIWAS